MIYIYIGGTYICARNVHWDEREMKGCSIDHTVVVLCKISTDSDYTTIMLCEHIVYVYTGMCIIHMLYYNINVYIIY